MIRNGKNVLRESWLALTLNSLKSSLNTKHTREKLDLKKKIIELETLVEI